MTEEDFWRKAYACLTCGKPHAHRVIKWRSNNEPLQYSWADPEDGHTYRTVIGIDALGTLRKHMEEED